MTKLKEFNSKVEKCLQLHESQIDKLQEALDLQRALTDDELNCLENTFKWPEGMLPLKINYQHLMLMLNTSFYFFADMLFPSLDILRLVVRNEKTVKHLCSSDKGDGIIQLLLSFLGHSMPAANHMLTLRTVSNFFFTDVSEDLLYASRNNVIGGIMQACNGVNMTKHLQIALATLLVNFSILFQRKGDLEAKSQLLSAAVTLIDGICDVEARFRLIVCIGTLIHNDSDAVDMAKSFNILVPVKKFREIIDPIKVAECAGFLEEMLS